MSKKMILLLRVLILLGLIAFAFFVAWHYGLLQHIIVTDRSYLSSVIFIIYIALSVHWLYVAVRLSLESDSVDLLGHNSQGPWPDEQGNLVKDLTSQLHKDLTPNQVTGLLDLFADQVSNRHSIGYFVSDVLLRLGLLGTIIGFILMLLPVSEIQEFDSSAMQRLLASMSGGMAVALYTTLTGLITSTLLRFQYHILESAAAIMVYRISLIVRSRFESSKNAT